MACTSRQRRCDGEKHLNIGSPGPTEGSHASKLAPTTASPSQPHWSLASAIPTAIQRGMGETADHRTTSDRSETSRQTDTGGARPAPAGDRGLRQVLSDRRFAHPGRSRSNLGGRRLEDVCVRGGPYLCGCPGLVGYRGRQHAIDHRRLGCGPTLHETSSSRSLVSGACRKARAIRARRRLASALISSGQSRLMVANRVSICSISSKNGLAFAVERRRDSGIRAISGR